MGKPDDTGHDRGLPVLPLRGVVFPHATRSFSIGRARSIRLVEALPNKDNERAVVLVLQRNPTDEDPGFSDLHPVGTVARMIQVAGPRSEAPVYVVLIAALQRVRLLGQTERDPYLRAEVELLEDVVPPVEDAEYQALRASLKKLLASYAERSPHLPDDVLPLIADMSDAGLLTDFAASSLPSLPVEERQALLETLDVRERLRRLTEELVKENDKLDLEQKIQTDMRQRLAGAQREMLLREQLKSIHRELGEDDDGSAELEDLRKRIDEVGMPEEVKKEAMRELGRLRLIPTGSAEQTVVRNYLDWLVNVPWSRSTTREVDINLAERILDEDHHDLEKVKQRILEYLAVLRLRREMKGPILCFVGPPGVGKTSLGRSIARALGRTFVRVSLGGVHDEGELRGHRRTYVGAMPGQIIQALRRAGTADPVFMLDEIDKLGRDFRGDPAAALLEVLDPEQNVSFRDHYLDVPFNLSRILFIGTANVLDPIPPALLDRMEILELSGYSEDEKLHIAQRFLVPRQLRESGLDGQGEAAASFTDDAILLLARHYTREAGVRNLEREIGALCRKHARRIITEPDRRMMATPEVVRAELGPPRFRIETEIERRTADPGVAVGLAWTPLGGDVLFVEATRIPGGTGALTLTGQLGEVMQESARAAFSWLRAHALSYGIEADELRRADMHVHVPAGAVPKDGPSAGLVMVAALVSAFTARRVDPTVAMTGEITLSGHVLPVGGIRDKVLAAKRSGIRAVILPEMNEVNVMEDIPEAVRAEVTFHYVRTIEEGLDHVLLAPLDRGSHAQTEGRPAAH